MKPSKPLRLTSLKWSSWYLAGLKLAVGLLLILLVVLFWLLKQDEADEQRSTLIADVLWLEQSINFHLEGNTEQFQQLANDLAGGRNGNALFELRGKYLLNNNPDLQQLIWLDDAARPIALFPSRELPRLGQNGGGIDIQSRSIEMARKLGKTVYTDAYRAGNASHIEVYSPIFAGGVYRGVLVGVYPLNSLLKNMVPWWFAEKYQVRILDGNGSVLASKSTIGNAATADSYTIPFDPPGFGMVFQVAPYRSSVNMAQTMIWTLIIALAAAMLLSLWVMRRHIQGRVAAEQALRSEHAFRKAMEDSLTVGMRARPRRVDHLRQPGLLPHGRVFRRRTDQRPPAHSVLGARREGKGAGLSAGGPRGQSTARGRRVSLCAQGRQPLRRAGLRSAADR